MLQKPNILIVMTDQQRADTVLPGHPAQMPNLRRMATEGLTFRETYCPTAHCCPSRATFFTGLYPSRTGIWNNIYNEQALGRNLRDGVRLWSEDLADHGYQLAWSGKWHVSACESPKDRGWEELFVSCGPESHHGHTWESYRRSATRFDKPQRPDGHILCSGYGTYRLFGESGIKETNHDERAVQKVVEALPKLAAVDRPWALYLGLNGPHDPYLVPQKYLDLYKDVEVKLPPSYYDTLEDKPRIYKRLREQRWGQLSEKETQDAVRHYWAYCTYLDDLFGRVLSALAETGQADNTLVLFCSDHGDYCADHGLFCKGVAGFRGAYNVPLIARWPQGIKNPGRTVDQLVSLADIAPTLLDMAGVEKANDCSGSSLMPFFRNEAPADWRTAVFTQFNGVELYYTQRCVRTKEYLYVFNGFDYDELYDLRADPHEMHNVAADPTYEPIKKELATRMWEFAYKEQDGAINEYITVALAPVGPGAVFQD